MRSIESDEVRSEFRCINANLNGLFRTPMDRVQKNTDSLLKRETGPTRNPASPIAFVLFYTLSDSKKSCRTPKQVFPDRNHLFQQFFFAQIPSPSVSSRTQMELRLDSDRTQSDSIRILSFLRNRKKALSPRESEGRLTRNPKKL